MEDEIPALADEIYRRKILRARQMTPAQRFEAGIELFEGSVKLMKDGIRHQFPEKTESEVDRILRQRLRRLKQLEEHGLFKKAQ